MSLVDVVIAFEDPFNDSSLDTISLLEVLDHISVMTSPSDGKEDTGSHANREHAQPSSQPSSFSSGSKNVDADDLSAVPPRASGDGDDASPGQTRLEDSEVQNRQGEIKIVQARQSGYHPEALDTGAAAAGGVVPPMPPMPPL
eukprot:gene20795-27628_t